LARRPGAHLADNGESVDIGQSKVQEQQVGLVTACLDLRARPRIGLDDYVSFPSEHHAQDTADRRLILDDQNAMRGLCHGSGSVEAM